MRGYWNCAYRYIEYRVGPVLEKCTECIQLDSLCDLTVKIENLDKINI